jgi:hypothetical protein
LSRRVLLQIKVKPRKVKVSGLPSPRRLVSALEPAILKLRSLRISAELAPALSNMEGLCVFLGKRSAKFQDAETQPRAPDAPFGVKFLREVDENPANPSLLTEPISVSVKAGGQRANALSRHRPKAEYYRQEKPDRLLRRSVCPDYSGLLMSA